MKTKIFIIIIFICLSHIKNPDPIYADEYQKINNFIGKNDAVLIADPEGNILFSKNADKKLIPASALKILTSLMVRHYLGNDYRFITEFYMDTSGNLKIKGYGDPLLVSEILPDIAKGLHGKTGKFNDLILDNSYFAPVSIPGVNSSLNPYDSPNGALCVNFNTVNFKRLKGRYVSAEPQTPLLPFVLGRIHNSGMNQERILLSSENDETTLYAGHLFLYFMEKEGIVSSGKIKMGRVEPENDRLVFTYTSRFTLDDLSARLLEYSNNFIANQLFITAGIKAYGSPGTLDKGRKAASAYINDVLKLDGIYMDEGSGISRETRISALNMLKVLEVFQPYHKLMRNKGREFYKTGSLTGVKTRAGYIMDKNGSFYRFAVLLNTPGKRAESVVSNILKIIN